MSVGARSKARNSTGSAVRAAVSHRVARSPAEEIGTFQPFEPGGCKTCNDRGYKGRVAVYEVMPLWDGLKELIIQGCSTAELKQEAIRLGFRTLRMSALNKVKAGMTSLAEATSNTAPDRF